MSRRSAALTFEFRICDDFSLTLSNSVKNEETFKTKTKKENLKKKRLFSDRTRAFCVCACANNRALYFDYVR